MVERFVVDNGTIFYKNENGDFHREDGPAIICSDGRKYWYKNGKFHREDGPAEIWPNGTKMWWLNGEIYSFSEWIKVVNISDEEKMELMLYYG